MHADLQRHVTGVATANRAPFRDDQRTGAHEEAAQGCVEPSCESKWLERQPYRQIEVYFGRSVGEKFIVGPGEQGAHVVNLGFELADALFGLWEGAGAAVE